MQKRGQVTVFIIVGILILGLAASIAYVTELSVTKTTKAEETYSEVSSLKLFVEDCLKKSTVEGMYLVFAQGGYYEFPLTAELFQFTEEDNVLEIPVYFQQKEVYLPAISSIETQIAKAAEKELLNCFNGFQGFGKQGYIIIFTEPIIEVRLSEKTNVMLDMPISAGKNGRETKLNKFFVSIPFNFNEKYNNLAEYLNKQEKDPDSFLIGEFSSQAYEKNYGFSFKQFSDSGGDVLVDLTYDENLKEEPLIYRFAMRFDWPADETAAEAVPKPSTAYELAIELKRLPEWNISSFGIHHLQVEALGEGLSYETSPGSLDINQNTGLISLNTNNFPNEEYLYYVKITDLFGQEIMAPLIINVNANDGTLPAIKPISKQTAKAGEEFSCQVEVLNATKPILFSTNSYLFNIDKKTGEIKFTPTKENIGIHSIKVEAENEYGKTWHKWQLEIK